jgi:hypothetical protein
MPPVRMTEVTVPEARVSDVRTSATPTPEVRMR